MGTHWPVLCQHVWAYTYPNNQHSGGFLAMLAMCIERGGECEGRILCIIHATPVPSTLAGLIIGNVRIPARAMAARLATLVLRTSMVSWSLCYVRNNPWCVGVCVRVGYGTYPRGNSSQHVDRAWHRQCSHTGSCCASSLRQFRGQNTRGRLAFCTLKAMSNVHGDVCMIKIRCISMLNTHPTCK